MDRSVILFGQEFRLAPEKALFWIDKSILIFSDVHLGKAASFQHRGVPIPNSMDADNFDVIWRLVQRYKPAEIFILGDLFHSAQGVTEDLKIRLQELISKTKIPWTLIEGNHDRHVKKKILGLSLTILDFKKIDDIYLSHDQIKNKNCIHGHIHPVFRLKVNRTSLRLPCFWRHKKSLVLPSFGAFTGGFEIEPQKGDQIYAVHEDITEFLF